ncbi:hypothetical protein NUW58_g19 [Xylaria curta]|uniref:Uncharacterized protein n=1 Tax=Xylaria curta TaxID=42375 RepID=A0ACC1PS82_9PEZI|nr:hypothetical protein NUW58_g19 [Xylaria curta]
MRRVLNSALALLAANASLLGTMVEAKLVFAHYLVGGIDPNTDHARQDIQQAAAVGFDAFALNIGRPNEDWLISAVNQLFDYADSRDDFKLFFSFDFYQTNDINAHAVLYTRFANRPSYLRYGDAKLPVVSSYSGGGIGVEAWRNFKTTNNVYLIPNPEADSNYYSQPATFFQTWGDVVDGVFSWETSWPDVSDTSGNNVSSARDEAVKKAADSAGKTYTMGMFVRTSVQALLRRFMLSPEFTEVITWNDAGESHYIGPSWPETVTKEILQYGDTDENPHIGWQPLVSSFINAFKSGASDTSTMVPANGASFAGAMWFQVRVTSGGHVLATQAVAAGLSYNSIQGLKMGAQLLELLDGNGNVMAKASSKKDVTDQPTDGFCNFNYYVAGLE